LSSQSVDLYIKPKNEQAKLKINHFTDLVNNDNYQGLITEFGDKAYLLIGHPEDSNLEKEILLEELEHYYSGDILVGDENGVLNLYIDMFPSIEFYDFADFMLHFDIEGLEASVYNSQVGEEEYYQNKDYFKNYKKITWKWLPEPDEEMLSEYDENENDDEDIDYGAVLDVFVAYSDEETKRSVIYLADSYNEKLLLNKCTKNEFFAILNELPDLPKNSKEVAELYYSQWVKGHDKIRATDKVTFINSEDKDGVLIFHYEVSGFDINDPLHISAFFNHFVSPLYPDTVCRAYRFDRSFEDSPVYETFFFAREDHTFSPFNMMGEEVNHPIDDSDKEEADEIYVEWHKGLPDSIKVGISNNSDYFKRLGFPVEESPCHCGSGKRFKNCHGQ